MKKNEKLNKRDYIVMGFIAVFALIAVFSYSAKAEGSFLDRLLALTSDKYAQHLASKTNVGELAESFGAFSSPDIYFDVFFHETVQTGGGKYSTTSNAATSETLTEADMLSNNYLYLMSNVGAFTWTLPATSTLTSMLQNVGDTREWLINNATSSSGITLTIAAGSGIDLIAVTNANDVIDEAEKAELKCTRVATTAAANDIVCIVSELVAAD